MKLMPLFALSLAGVECLRQERYELCRLLHAGFLGDLDVIGKVEPKYSSEVADSVDVELAARAEALIHAGLEDAELVRRGRV